MNKNNNILKIFSSMTINGDVTMVMFQEEEEEEEQIQQILKTCSYMEFNS